MKTITLKINGMHCNSCVKLIELELSELNGMKSIIVDLAHDSASFTYDDAHLHEQTIEHKIQELGYSTSDNLFSKN